MLLGGQDRDPPSSDTYSEAVLGNAPGELKKPFFSKPNTKVTFMGLKTKLSYDRGEEGMMLALEKTVMSSYGRRQKRNTWARNGPDLHFTVLKGADNYFHWNPERTEIPNFPTVQEGN